MDFTAGLKNSRRSRKGSAGIVMLCCRALLLRGLRRCSGLLCRGAGLCRGCLVSRRSSRSGRLLLSGSRGRRRGFLLLAGGHEN